MEHSHVFDDQFIVFVVVFSAIVTDALLLFSLVEKAKLCYVHFNKKPSLDFKKLEKMSGLEPKVRYRHINPKWEGNACESVTGRLKHGQMFTTKTNSISLEPESKNRLDH